MRGEMGWKKTPPLWISHLKEISVLVWQGGERKTSDFPAKVNELAHIYTQANKRANTHVHTHTQTRMHTEVVALLRLKEQAFFIYLFSHCTLFLFSSLPPSFPVACNGMPIIITVSIVVPLITAASAMPLSSRYANKQRIARQPCATALVWACAVSMCVLVSSARLWWCFLPQTLSFAARAQTLISQTGWPCR